MPMHARRVLAYLSLHKMVEQDCDRQVLAERLWIDAPPDRSRASLRTAIWRIRSAAYGLLDGDSERVALADSVRVDVHEFRRQAEQMLADTTDYESPGLVPHLRSPADLLPGWDEDWLLLTREQLRLLRLHALEHTARRMCERGLYAQTIDVILSVVDEEPLRESAQGILIKAHLCAGNPADAIRQYDRFRSNLWKELGLRPSPDLCRLISPRSKRTATLSNR
ncbi:AfsR/SARP family transcriptional regulator [Mycolicibacterium nivoides]|uniref:BTAD domain-containing putative transcriptional regulator n=3 Tax=Mycolicibacterium nivoides TaxID=2487344 RepID=A0ABW9LFP1_9MYCO